MNTISPLIPAEEVIAMAQPERIYALVFLLPKLFLAVLIAALSLYFEYYFFLLLSLFIFLIGAYKYKLVLSCKFYLTGQQLIYERGVFTQSVNYIELYRVKDILVNQSFWMKAFNLMNVTLLSFDTSEPFMIIKGIKVSGLAQNIRNHVQECRQRNKVLSIDN